QVLRTVTALNAEGFFEITTYETLLRPYELSPSSSLPTIFDAANKIKESERKREDKRIMQVKGDHRGISGKQEKERKRRGRRKLEDGEESDSKRAKTKVEGMEETEPVIVSEPSAAEYQARPTPRGKVVEGGKVLARVMPEVRGHTSYLTFAVLLPALPGEEQETANGELVEQIEGQVEAEDVQMKEAQV
ncbi:hypothetical protein MPER_06468, partial [Moniliophthora perniciosa FA553]